MIVRYDKTAYNLPCRKSDSGADIHGHSRTYTDIGGHSRTFADIRGLIKNAGMTAQLKRKEKTVMQKDETCVGRRADEINAALKRMQSDHPEALGNEKLFAALANDLFPKSPQHGAALRCLMAALFEFGALEQLANARERNEGFAVPKLKSRLESEGWQNKLAAETTYYAMLLAGYGDSDLMDFFSKDVYKSVPQDIHDSLTKAHSDAIDSQTDFWKQCHELDNKIFSIDSCCAKVDNLRKSLDRYEQSVSKYSALHESILAEEYDNYRATWIIKTNEGEKRFRQSRIREIERNHDLRHSRELEEARRQVREQAEREEQARRLERQRLIAQAETERRLDETRKPLPTGEQEQQRNWRRAWGEAGKAQKNWPRRIGIAIGIAMVAAIIATNYILMGIQTISPVTQDSMEYASIYPVEPNAAEGTATHRVEPSTEENMADYPIISGAAENTTGRIIVAVVAISFAVTFVALCGIATLGFSKNPRGGRKDSLLLLLVILFPFLLLFLGFLATCVTCSAAANVLFDG